MLRNFGVRIAGASTGRSCANLGNGFLCRSRKPQCSKLDTPLLVSFVDWKSIVVVDRFLSITQVLSDEIRYCWRRVALDDKDRSRPGAMVVVYPRSTSLEEIDVIPYLSDLRLEG
ncbi:hypothetical protein CVT26_014378 [Gymnopilus dilepis]|uniref:Uncharacterized protein n=1 Tax=Gymnopilus dilepis TaxID=231916 RepID=A0A409WTM3_9AGAR|nr:hypothetical protein CVT26_014378 [Gymnopilus dilepis]